MNKINYNPDVLSCIANLSSDEVFTPPSLVNKMLDLLPNDLWSNKNAKFLDPATKLGVFLREIAKRLLIGLEGQIPNTQERVNHIFQNQIYGIATTELTSLLARRSLYCSKLANGKYSVCEFDEEKGNIIYDNISHSFKNGKCTFCGANQEAYDRGDEYESHAYQFIHESFEKFKDMKFDVIIGNPPYQLSDAGDSTGASPIYNLFVEQAKKLNPRYLSMIIPARWYSGGKGLDDFRNHILNEGKISQIHDFPETDLLFPGLNVRGGICYFLWEKENKGACKVFNYSKEKGVNVLSRPLLENDVEIFIRYNQAVNILRKVKLQKEESFSQIVSSRKPFGLSTNFTNFTPTKKNDSNILLYRFGKNGFVSANDIDKNTDWINKIKVLVPKASPGGDYYPHAILGKPIVAEANSACTETYVVIGPFEKKMHADNVASYLSTRFARFMILLIKNTQDVARRVYSFVPMQDFNNCWTDEKLYKKYDLDADEISFIESMIRPME